jgi:hypothetical protein
MPDKRYVKGCGKGCTRCWYNRLNHGSKLKKKMFPKHFEIDNEENEEKKYNSYMEEFIDKYIISNYTHERMAEINDDQEINYKLYNEDLIEDTVLSYNAWIIKEKYIINQIKQKNLIGLMKTAIRNAYFNTCLSKYNEYYMFKCTYKQDEC